MGTGSGEFSALQTRALNGEAGGAVVVAGVGVGMRQL